MFWKAIIWLFWLSIQDSSRNPIIYSYLVRNLFNVGSWPTKAKLISFIGKKRLSEGFLIVEIASFVDYGFSCTHDCGRGLEGPGG